MRINCILKTNFQAYKVFKKDDLSNITEDENYQLVFVFEFDDTQWIYDNFYIKQSNMKNSLLGRNFLQLL